jgi:hypothetical protein
MAAFCNQVRTLSKADLRTKIMSPKKFLVAFVSAFVFIFLWGWLYNGVLLRGVYAETQNLWRPQAETMALFHWIILGEAVLVLAFVMIYASGFAGGGVMAGIRFGIMVEILAIGARMMVYAAQPIPAKLIVYWSIGGFVEMIVTGAIVGAIYKPKADANG